MRGQTKTKRVFATVLVLTVAMASFFVRGARAATIRTEPLNLSEATEDIANDEEGWSWDASTKTLTLENFEAVINTTTTDAMNFAIVLPDDSTIVAKGDNSIKNANAYGGGISATCGLEIRGENGATFNFDVWRYAYSEVCVDRPADILVKDLTITAIVDAYYVLDSYTTYSAENTQPHDSSFTLENVNITSSSKSYYHMVFYPDNYTGGKNTVTILNSEIHMTGSKAGEIISRSLGENNLLIENSTIDAENGFLSFLSANDSNATIKDSTIAFAEGQMNFSNTTDRDGNKYTGSTNVTTDNSKVTIKQSRTNSAAIYVGGLESLSATFNITNNSDVDAEITYTGTGNKAAIQIERDGGPFDGEGAFVLNIKDSKVRAVNSMPAHANAGITIEHQNIAEIDIDNSEVYASGVTGMFATSSDTNSYKMNNANININNSKVTAIGTGSAEASTGYGAAITAGAKSATTNVRVNNSELKLVSNNYNGINALGSNKEISIVNSTVDSEGIAGELAAILGDSTTARSFIELDANTTEKDLIDNYIAENNIELQSDALFRALTTFDGQNVNNDADDDFVLKYPTGISRDNAADCAIAITHFLIDETGAIVGHEEIPYEATDEGMLVHSKMGYFVIAYDIPPEPEPDPAEPINPATLDGILGAVAVFTTLSIAFAAVIKFAKR